MRRMLQWDCDQANAKNGIEKNIIEAEKNHSYILETQTGFSNDSLKMLCM